MKQSPSRLILAGAMLFAATCSESPSAPTPTTNTNPPATTIRPALSLTLSNPAGQRTSSGYSYSVQHRLQETAGASASVASVTVALLDGGSGSIASLNRTTDLASTQISANATATFTSSFADDVAGHVYASRLQVTVVYSDTAGSQSVVASIAVPSLPVLPATYTVCGTVKDGGSAVPDIEVTIVGTARSTKTDQQGKYCFSDLAAGTITLQIIRSGYNTLQQSVTVTGNVTVDLALIRTPVANVSIDSFNADSTVITKGQSTTLRWAVTNSTGVSIDNGIGTVSASGSRSIAPSALSTTYRITATGNGGPVSRTVSVTAADPAAMTCTVPTPAGVTAVCNNGQYSMSQNAAGTCSSNGGVQCWVCPGVLCKQ